MTDQARAGDDPTLVTDDSLLDAVLARLDLAREESAQVRDLAALTRAYRCWCLHVPFDNVRKRIFQAAGASGPVPGASATAFLTDFVDGGTGGTCWSTSFGLVAVLRRLGFEASLKAATMMTDPDTRPNHCSVAVELGPERHYILDTSILHMTPLAIPPVGAESRISSPLHPIRMRRPNAEEMEIDWLPAHARSQFVTTLVDRAVVPGADVVRWHDRTRGYSLFNQALYVRRNTADGILVYGRSRFIRVDPQGRLDSTMIDRETRDSLLVERFGLSPAVVARIPADDSGPAFL